MAFGIGKPGFHDISATGGVHSGTDAAKAVMCGADAVHLVSVLLPEGSDYVAVVRQELADWMEANEYESLGQLGASMSLDR